MSFFDILVLDTILILFPIICMLIIKAGIMNNNKISDNKLIDIANLTSLFLLIKYCNIDNAYMVLLVNMPFIISILYDRKYTSIIISIIIIAFNISIGSIPALLIVEYLIYLIVFVFLNKKGISVSTILISFISIKGFFLTIYEYYMLNNKNFLTIIEIFICLVTFYLIGILVINIINMIDKTVTLNQSLKELEKEKSLKNALFKITHEIKNPIAVCKGYFEMMDYGDIEKVKKYNSIIKNELNRTLDIMDNFSEYTKIKINPDIMDFDYLITDTIKNMNSLFKNKNIQVIYEEKEEVYINGDYFRLQQVLINMLKNSIEAIGYNGIINIELRKNNKQAILSIKDNGCGINKNDLKKITELFYSSKEKGCGIGVTLSKEIINLHEGSIKYKSEEGKYTEVIIKIPLFKTLHNNM